MTLLGIRSCGCCSGKWDCNSSVAYIYEGSVCIERTDWPRLTEIVFQALNQLLLKH